MIYFKFYHNGNMVYENYYFQMDVNDQLLDDIAEMADEWPGYHVAMYDGDDLVGTCYEYKWVLKPGVCCDELFYYL